MRIELRWTWLCKKSHAHTNCGGETMSWSIQTALVHNLGDVSKLELSSAVYISQLNKLKSICGHIQVTCGGGDARVYVSFELITLFLYILLYSFEDINLGALHMTADLVLRWMVFMWTYSYSFSLYLHITGLKKARWPSMCAKKQTCCRLCLTALLLFWLGERFGGRRM